MPGELAARLHALFLRRLDALAPRAYAPPMDTIPHSTRGKRRAPRDAAAMAELREARERAGLSLSAVAERLGSSRQWVSQLERCVWPCPESTYRRLREIVGLSLLLMLTGCAAECDHDPTLEELCAQWVDGGSLVHVATLEPGDLGWELCVE